MTQADLGLDRTAKRVRKRALLDEMERVVLWDRLTALIEPHDGTKRKKSGVVRLPFGLATLLRIHFLQQWFALSDPAIEEGLCDVPLFREFAQLPTGVGRLPDESTILRFRHLRERHDLAAVNDTLRAKGLLRGQQEHVVVDAGNHGAAKRPEATGKAQCHVALKAGERQPWKKVPRTGKWIESAEKVKASVRAKAEHPFWG